MKEYRRKHRAMPEETKLKISKALKGKSLTEEHRKNISIGVKNYWEQIPE